MLVLFQHGNSNAAPRQAHCGKLKPACTLAAAARLDCSRTERGGHHLTEEEEEEEIQKEAFFASFSSSSSHWSAAH